MSVLFVRARVPQLWEHRYRVETVVGMAESEALEALQVTSAPLLMVEEALKEEAPERKKLVAKAVRQGVAVAAQDPDSAAAQSARLSAAWVGEEVVVPLD